ncbi:MAG TPA: Ig-like domain-containing protein [Gemmatimonadales bacterium]|nr:Ig-like domain-containing protein [Gemmatimonadales bacterium]
MVWAPVRRLPVALAACLALAGCAPEGPSAPAREATLFVRADVSATLAVTLVLEVTAPDLATPLVFNIPVVNGVAAATVKVAAGSDRTFTLRAYDAGGVETHRGATTAGVHPGTNRTISLVLAPLTGAVPIEATLGSVLVTVTPASPRLAVGESVQLTATITDGNGDPLAGTVAWATVHPGVASVDGTGLVTAAGAGQARIVATFAGVGGSAMVTVVRVGWYASPTGSSSGTGRWDAPWDLQTALAGGGAVRPGDTVWVRGGTYVGSFISRLAGVPDAPIVVRTYPEERAVIDGNGTSTETFIVEGSWAVYWGLEVTNSMTARFGEALGLRPTGVFVRNASHIRLINFVVHDVGHGVFTHNETQYIEIYGWIVYNGGHQGSIRSDGHAIYIKNDGLTPKVVRDNVLFNMFGFGVHCYTDAGTGALKNLLFEGNVAFNNGELSDFNSPNFQVGGHDVADDVAARDNMLYFSPGLGAENVRLGFARVVNGAMVFERNYVVGGAPVLQTGYWRDLDVRGNTWVGAGNMAVLEDPSTAGQQWEGNLAYRDPLAGAWYYKAQPYTFPGWQQATGLGPTDAATGGVPAEPTVFVRRNRYEAGRGFVVIYNWTRQPAVAVDLADVVPPGYRYEVRNVQALFAPPVASGIYAGGPVDFPMSGVTPPTPIGGSPRSPGPTGPDFDVFLVTSAPPP